jgi:hypothetical protein
MTTLTPLERLRRHVGRATGFRVPGDDGSEDDDITRAVQHYLGHKNIQHTVRYTELSPERFKSFWED